MRHLQFEIVFMAFFVYFCSIWPFFVMFCYIFGPTLVYFSNFCSPFLYYSTFQNHSMLFLTNILLMISLFAPVCRPSSRPVFWIVDTIFFCWSGDCILAQWWMDWNFDKSFFQAWISSQLALIWKWIKRKFFAQTNVWFEHETFSDSTK